MADGAETPKTWRALKGVDYIPAVYDPESDHRIRVIGRNVLVLMDEVSEKLRSGLLLPDIEAGTMAMAAAGAETGVLVACAKGAFLVDDDGCAWRDEKPKPGDRVYIEKYAGALVRGVDMKVYRIMSYINVKAVYDPGPEIDETTGAVINGKSNLEPRAAAD